MNSLESNLLMEVQNRSALTADDLDSPFSRIGKTIGSPERKDKVRVALELYAAHFSERQVRVRFLLLVIAMESLAIPTSKHQVALNLLERWQREIKAEMAGYNSSLEEYKSLESLSRELNFRAEDSIRSQIRKLFRGLNGSTDLESNETQRRALRVYDKRSTLVHDGYLPHLELAALEDEARQLLEMVFTSIFASSL